jgi:VWFA-related protein
MLSRAIFVCLSSAAALFAQGMDFPNAAAPAVHLTVIAKDARGQPVTDLTRDDFQVYEGSKLQRLTGFRRSDAAAKRALRPEPGEFSNRTGTPTVPATVILFDLLNARFEDRGSMIQELVPALQHVESSDSLFFYILTMNGALYAVHGLQVPTPGAKPWTDDIKALLDNASREFFHLRPVGVDVDMRVRMTYKALGSLADLVAAAPGRKSLIWISHGVPISLGPGNRSIYDSVDYTPLLQRLTSTLDRAGVAVYTVRQPESMAPRTGGAAGGAAGEPSAEPPGGITMSTEETLEQFAQLTGGHAFMTPDIRAAISLAASDARLSYQLAYEPPAGGWDGKYHKIRVACTRKGVKLETKQGYYAFADMAAGGISEKAALESAMASALDATEIGLSVRLSEHQTAPRNVELAIRIDPADIAWPQDAARLSVSVAGYMKDTRKELFPSEELTPKRTADPIPLEKRLVIADGVESLRVLVYDRESGAIGSLTIPVK